MALKKKKVILSVTNDLTSEQRVHKVCLFLQRMGMDVTLVGRITGKSLPLEERPYATRRLFLLFEKGPLFYAEYNLRLFLYLLTHPADILVSNDLDTLLANYLAGKLTAKVLVHDSHEYFTGVPELEGRSFARNAWKAIERWIFPRLKFVYTVNDSIARLYRDEYGVEARVVRNFPMSSPTLSPAASPLILERGAEGKAIVLYQGSVNVDRGLLEAVEAMQYVAGAVLVIVGDGDILDEVKSKTRKLNLQNKVAFHKKVPFGELKRYTARADIGISLDKDTNLNYRFSLPNKIFDYVHAGVPVLASGLAEIKKVYEKYEIGLMTEGHNPREIADKINFMLSDPLKREHWKRNCLAASAEFCWEQEEKVLLNIYSQVIGEEK